ncbi:MAG: flavin reductase family protein [Burkholderiales bacterium]|nr:flavin reductase family protein [Burkholderiales bacterium]
MSALPPPIEQGEPHADARAFRRCLGQFATGVAVMTAQHEGQLAGIVVNSFASLSLDPPLILWSIRRESASLPLFRRAGRFAVNVLSAEQLAVSNRFAASRADKFNDADWSPGRHGAPLLAGCLAHLECRLEQALDGGDHLLIVGRVERYARFHGEPLLFTQGHYAVAQEHPALSVPAA